MKSFEERLKKLQIQSKEFAALVNLYKAYKNLPAVVDDDYPEMRHRYEQEMRNFIEAIEANGRLLR